MLRKTPLKRGKKKPPSASDKRHLAFVGSLPCLVCGDRATVHHVTGYADRMGRFARSDRLVTPLCPMHHQKVHDPIANDPVSVEGLGHRGFYEKYGIDLLAVAERLRDCTEIREAGCERNTD